MKATIANESMMMREHMHRDTNDIIRMLLL